MVKFWALFTGKCVINEVNDGEEDAGKIQFWLNLIFGQREKFFFPHTRTCHEVELHCIHVFNYPQTVWNNRVSGRV